MIINNSRVELTKNFENELSKNFCAMKYFYQQTEYRQMCIAEKAKRLNENEIKDYVRELGNIIV